MNLNAKSTKQLILMHRYTLVYVCERDILPLINSNSVKFSDG